jgi:hypothetical protein
MKRSPDAATGSPAEHKAEIASAALVVQALAKADRGFAIYLPNNPLHEKFFEDFCARIGRHLGEFGTLRLDLTHDTMLCRGETIYTNPELRENLAFRMYADDIRALLFEPDVERAELRAFVQILGSPAAADDEDDIVTRLWSSDLPHLTYQLAEVQPEAGSLGLGPGASLTSPRAAQEGALRRYVAELAAAPPPTPLLPPLAQQVFSLSEEEIAALQGLLAQDEGRTPLEDMACILEAIIAAEQDVAVLDEFLAIVARLCGDLMITGRVDQAVGVLAMLRRAAGHPALPQGHAARIEASRAQVVTADVLAGLSRLLAGGDGLDRELLRTLVAELGSAAIGPFCTILGEVPGKETRKVLIEALAGVGRGSPELFLPFLLDPRWYLVRNTIYILRRVAGPESAQAIWRCAGHRDPRVRKEVLLYLDEAGDPAADAVRLGFLADETPALRVAALRSLGRRAAPGAVERLLAIAGAPEFAERELLEREATWEALGALAPARVFPLLKQLLLKRRWFAPAQDLDATACACAGLRRIGGAAAIEVLREAAAAKRGESRALIEKTLRSLAQGRGAPARPGDAPPAEAGRG